MYMNLGENKNTNAQNVKKKEEKHNCFADSLSLICRLHAVSFTVKLLQF